MYPNCECNTWARAYDMYVVTPHHRNCKSYDANAEVTLLQQKLEKWLAAARQEMPSHVFAEYELSINNLTIIPQAGTESKWKRGTASQSADLSQIFNSLESEWSPAKQVKLAADSIEQLRKQDVYRLFQQCEPEHWLLLSVYLQRLRPDLITETQSCYAEMIS